MFEGLSNEEIITALNELINLLGVKEDISTSALLDLIRKKKIEECVQEIATLLYLPIRIRLSYITEEFRTDNIDRFRSSTLSRYDWTGRSIEGITAQVIIPKDIPMFGTSAFEGYPIKVRVNDNCHAYPYTFVTIIVHELSHVLLASLMSPYKDSELHADLVPIILGFRNIVRKGRKMIENTKNHNIITKRTTTYGYLTDSQFEFAFKYVIQIIKRHQRKKKNLIEAMKKLQSKLNKVAHSFEVFLDYFNYIDMRPPDKMRPEHTQRIVQLHAQDYRIEWESRITTVRKNIAIVETFVRSLNHYTSSAVERLNIHTQEIELAANELDQIIKVINKDKRILRKYVGLIYRLRRALWRHS